MDIVYDFHIHSCLSPCGDDSFTPELIVECALAKELNAIALTDHNTCRNCPAFLAAAEKAGLLALPGMELQTAEEIHVVCLFSTLADAERFEHFVELGMLPLENAPDIFGNQIIHHPDGSQSSESRMLLTSSSIPLHGLYDLVGRYGGIAIPAHIDREAFSIGGVLGGMEEYSEKNRDFPTVEVYSDYSAAKNRRWIQNSDAHGIDRFFESEYHTFPAQELSVAEIFRYLSGQEN